MKYQDINGKTGFKDLKGNSGRTYGNTRLFTEEEKQAMFNDGIVEWTPPPKAEPDPLVVAEKEKNQKIENMKKESRDNIIKGVTARDDISDLSFEDSILEMFDKLSFMVSVLAKREIGVRQEEDWATLKDMINKLDEIRNSHAETKVMVVEEEEKFNQVKKKKGKK